MEDLYSDLENYQHENVVSELRNENQELKCKLEEYSSTLATLQKDFDKLSVEYKKLELNYSSLLKTARAEIERKSQLITNLNIEKDNLVINSIKNGGQFQYRKVNAMGNRQHTAKEWPKVGDSVKEANVAAVSTSTNNYSVPFNQDRKDKYDKITPSLGPTLNDDPYIKENEQKSWNSDYYIGREKKKNEMKSKENQSDFNDAFASNISKIRHRRKSMPFMNRDDYKFSSDEDQDDAPKDRFRRRSPIRDDRIVTDQIYQDKHRNGRNDGERKNFDFTRLGDKYASNFDATRDVCRKNNSRYRDSDRHKSRHNRDKYDSKTRLRKHYSPERQYNIQGECYNKYRVSNERTYKTDNVRHRTLVSPPPERYNQHRRSRECDGQRVQHEELHPIKHKMHHAIEEPACKRFRSESLNKHTEKLHDRDGGEGLANSVSKSFGLSYLSLRSPDHLENNPSVHQVKEIKSTSDIKLDDPRLTSKKYMVNNTYKDKIMLSTVVGRDVDIKTIDKNAWNRNKSEDVHELPILLREKPPIKDDILNDIYMGIDNPISNLSLESGEICLEEEMGIVSKNKSTVTVNPEDSDNKSGNTNIQKLDQNEIDKKEATTTNDNTQKTFPTLLSKNYRITKIKKLGTSKLLEDDNTSSKHNKQNKRVDTKQGHKKKRDEEKKSQSEATSLKIFSDAIDICENKRDKLVDNNRRSNDSPEKDIISARDTVEGDLELSDETCDYVEGPDETKYDKGNNFQKLGESNKNIVIDGTSKDFKIAEPEKSDYIDKEHAVFKHGMETVCQNKHFNISHKLDDFKLKESLSKTNKEPKSKDIKNKLCDLFGDTSSLITLDDLGVTSTTAKENLNLYAPLFDNTQDALDLNVEEMEKVQTRSKKLTHDEDELVKNENQDVKSEKKESKKGKILSDKVNQKFNSRTENSSLQNIFKNVNGEPEDNTVVRTVIISTGIQNNCQSVDDVRDQEQNKQITTLQRKTNDNATSCPSILSIKALATSTPYKPLNEPSLSVPEISNSDNTSVTKNPDMSSNNEKISKNSDIPDVRIIVKRRRKAKGAP